MFGLPVDGMTPSIASELSKEARIRFVVTVHSGYVHTDEKIESASPSERVLTSNPPDRSRNCIGCCSHACSKHV